MSGDFRSGDFRITIPKLDPDLEPFRPRIPDRPTKPVLRPDRPHDVSELDPEFASVKQRSLKQVADLRLGDRVIRVPGHPYGIGRVTKFRPERGSTNLMVTIEYPDELGGDFNVSLGMQDRLEMHDPSDAETP